MPETKSSVLLRAEYLQRFTLKAVDGDVGTVSDLLFDDQDRVVRYLVIDTGVWIFGREILFSPEAIDEVDWEEETLYVSLKRDEFERSPDIDLQEPVSRQALTELHEYYSWPMWHSWGVGTRMQPVYYPMVGVPEAEAQPERDRQGTNVQSGGDPHLRSANEVLGYDVHARDDEAGSLEDIFIGGADWALEFLTVEVGGWLPEKKVLISMKYVADFDHIHRKINLKLDRDQLENCTEFDPEGGGTERFSLAYYRYMGFDPYMIRFTS